MSEPTDAQVEAMEDARLDGQIADYEQQRRDPWSEPVEVCTCVPCESPARGAPGLDHCAACCYGSLIEEYDHNCPVDEHRDLAERQHPSHLLISEVGPVVPKEDV